MDCPFMPGRFHDSPPVTPIDVPISGVGVVYTTGCDAVHETGVGPFYAGGLTFGPATAPPFKPWWVAYTKAIAEGKMNHWHDASFKYGYEAGVQDGKKSRQTEIDSLKRAFSAADAQLDRIREVIDEGFE